MQPRMLNDVATIIDEKTRSLKYYETLNKLGSGSATKYILPLELTDLAKGLTNNNHSSDNHRVDADNQKKLPGEEGK